MIPTRLAEGDPPPTQVTLLHLDDSGLLYVYGLGPTRHWRSPVSLGRAPTWSPRDPREDDPEDLLPAVEIVSVDLFAR